MKPTLFLGKFPSCVWPQGRLLRLVLSALLFVGVGLITAPAFADVLVSNITESSNSGSGFHAFDLAQGFTTGSDSNGYSVTDIVVDLSTKPSSNATITMRLATGLPSSTTTLATLTNPASWQKGRNTFTAPSGTYLLPDTTYYIVMEGSSGSSSSTTSTAESGTSGWSLGDTTYYRNASSTGSWLSSSSMRRVEVNGVTLTSSITQVAVTSTPTSGTGTPKKYGGGEKIQVTVTFTQAATVTGDPVFEIRLGNSNNVQTKNAAYVRGSDTTALVFEYTVQSSDRDNNGIWIEENALTLDEDDAIQDSDSTDMTLEHSALRGQSDHKVDGSLTYIPNTAPTASNNTVTTDEDTAYTFAAGEFNFSDTDSSGTLASVKIVTLPSVGSLTHDGNAVTANQVITKADIDANKLEFTPAANANGAGYTSFTFKVSDGIDESASAYTMTVDVDAAPDITQVAVTSTPTSGTTTPKKYGRGEKIQVTVTFDEAVDVTSDPVFEIRMGSSGNTPASENADYVSGTGTTALVFEYTVQPTDQDDNGIWIRENPVHRDSDDKIRGSNGNDADLTHAQLGGQSNHKVDGSLTPPGSNTAPTASNNTVTTNEDTAYTFAAGNFNFSDTDSSDTLASVKIVTLPSVGSLTHDGSAVTANQVVTKANIDANKLVFTPVANANGAGYASFTFKVSDGTDESALAYTMTIDVDAVNDAPTLENAIPNQQATSGTAFSYTLPANTFTDVDDTLSYTATKGDDSALPSWLTFTAATRVFAGQPSQSDVGTLSVKVTASDGSDSVSDTFDIVVAPPSNTDPVIDTTSPINVPENSTSVVTLSATDPDPGATASWSLVGGEDQSHFSLSGAVLSFGSAKDFENHSDTGNDNTYKVRVQVEDDRSATVTKDLVVTRDRRGRASLLFPRV